MRDLGMMDTIVHDAYGKQIRVGDLVTCDHDYPAGTVVLISDPDGDVDDEGRPFGINPGVYVRWNDGEPPIKAATKYDPAYDEKFGTSFSYWTGDVFVCDDLEVIRDYSGERGDGTHTTSAWVADIFAKLFPVDEQTDHPF